jgi:NitT/TauT family transport system substrate-binding protein
MWYNEYHTILNSGYNPDELVTFFFSEYNLNFPEDGIYCLEETYERDKNLCMNFVAASFDGWRYAFNHIEEALDIVIKFMKQRHIPANRPHQRWMLNRMKDIILIDEIPFGSLNKEDFLTVCEELKKQELIKKVPEFELIYKEHIGNDQ